MQHLIVIVPQKGEFETILSGIESDRARARRAVEAMNRLALDTSQVHGVVERADYSMVAV